MTHGLQTFDANGVALLNTTDTVGRVYGKASTGTTNGSITVTGEPIWAFTPTLFYNYGMPSITSSGSTISWTFSDPSSPYNVDVPFIYGSKGGAPGSTAGNTFGLEVLNEQGSVQVDSNYSNFGLTASGTVTLTQDPLPHPQRMVIADITVTGAAPLLAFAASARPVNVERMRQQGNQFTFRLRAQNWEEFDLAYWVFDTASYTIGANTAQHLEVRDQFGGLTFHDGIRPLRVVDQINLPLPPDSWTGTRYHNSEAAERRVYAPGRTYAVIQSSVGLRFEEYELGPQDLTVQLPAPGNALYRSTSHYGAASLDPSLGAVDAEASLFEIFENEYLKNQLPDRGNSYGTMSWWVVDVSGYGTAPPATDFTPNPVAWANLNVSSIENVVIGQTAGAIITGINQPITLRATVTGVTESFADGYVYAMKNNSAVANVHYAETGAGLMDFTVAAGDTVSFYIDGVTGSGIRTGTGAVSVTNLSDGGALLDSFTFSLTADSDNNYNLLDVTPDPFTVQALSLSTTAETGVTNASFHQITGINSPVTLRWTRDNLVTSGNAFTRRLFVFKSTTGAGGPWTQHFLAAQPGLTLDIQFNNGDWFYTQALLDTTSYYASASWTNYITNLNTGALLASYGVSAVVDSDNNFPGAPDYSANPMSFPNLSWSSPENLANAPVYYHGLTGTNQPISVRVHVYNLVSNTSDGYFYMVRTANNSWFTRINTYAGSPDTYVDVTVQPGEAFYFYADATTSSGLRSVSYGVALDNLNTGERIGQFTVNGTVDNDNNYNVVTDTVPDAIAFSGMYAVSGDLAGTVTANSGTYTLTGFTEPVVLRLWHGIWYHTLQCDAPGEILQPGEGPCQGSSRLDIFRNGVHVGSTPTWYLNGDYSGGEDWQYGDLWFSPGDTLSFRIYSTITPNDPSWPATAHFQGGIYVDNLTGGNRLGSFQHDTIIYKPQT